MANHEHTTNEFTADYDEYERELLMQMEAQRQELSKVLSRARDIEAIIRCLLRMRTRVLEEARPFSQEIGRLNGEIADHYLSRTAILDTF